MKKIIIATIKSRNIENAKKLKKACSGKHEVLIVDHKDLFSVDNVNNFDPDYIFVPHWSWIIPAEIYTKYKCIIFHTADLPSGRGGSPLQNQIISGVKNSYVCAIQCADEVDSGDIYSKEPVYLGRGNIDEILLDISDLIFKKMIPDILERDPVPVPQKGKIVTYKRRTEKQSNIQASEVTGIDNLYDFIRMLDGEGYPKANLEIGNFKISFSNVSHRGDKLEGRFEIHEK